MDYLFKRPMLLCALISSIAAIVGYYSKNGLLFLGIVIIAFFFIVLYKKLNSVFVVVCVFSFLTVVSSFLQTAKIKEISYTGGNVCKGEYIVISEPVIKEDYYKTVIEVKQSDMLEKGTKIDVICYEECISLSDVIIADVSVESLEDSQYKMNSYSQKIYLSGNMKNIQKTQKKEVVLKNISSLRGYIKQKIFKNYDFSEAATVLALITGDKSYFTDEFYKNVKLSGVSHVMVVSGMHLSVIITFLLFFIRKFFYNRYLKALVIFIAVIIVAAVCGFTMSIIRAGITYILISVSLLLNRPNTSSNSLGAAVCLILINNPLAVFNVVFQLTVLSTLGILVVASPCIEFVERKQYINNKLLFGVFSASLISISATIFTAPVAIYYFGYISNVSLITNLLVCTPATVALCLAVLGIIFVPFGKVFFLLSEIIVKYVNAVINYFGSLIFAATDLPFFAVYFAVGIIIILLCVLLACKKRLNVLKLTEMNNKRIKEGGGKIKWRSYTKKI